MTETLKTLERLGSPAPATTRNRTTSCRSCRIINRFPKLVPYLATIKQHFTLNPHLQPIPVTQLRAGASKL